jgi:hypothetical protein
MSPPNRKTRLTMVLLGAIVIVTIEIFGHLSSACESVVKNAELVGSANCVDYWLNRYQTLATGFIAIGSAIYGGYYLNKQIDVTREIEECRQERADYATRAMLPMALSGVLEFSNECIERVTQLYFRIHGSAPLSVYPPIVCPAPPSAAISVIKESILFSNINARERMADLLAKLQIQRARFDGLIDLANTTATINDHQLASAYADLIELNAVTNSLFAYSRRERDEPLKVSITAEAYSIDENLNSEYLRELLKIKAERYSRK